MAIRLSGMVSGLDTDSVVQALMSAQKYKKTKIEASKQKLEWKQELWSEMNTKIYNFYKSSLSKMRMQSTFKTKSASSSDSSKITATAASNATEGTYRIKVQSVASAQYVTSGVLGDDVNTGTRLKDLGFDENVQIQFTAKNGANKGALLVDENTTVDDFLNAAKSVGINASFDTTQKRFFLGSASSGDDQKFTITAYDLNTDQKAAADGLKESIGYKYLSGSDQTAASKIMYQLQTGDKSVDEAKEALTSYLDKAAKDGITAEIKKQVTDSYKNYFTYDGEGNKTGVTASGKSALRTSLQNAGKSNDEINAVINDSTKLLSATESLVSENVKKVMESDTVSAQIETAVSQGMGSVSGFTVDGVGSFSITASGDSFLDSSRDTRLSTLSAKVTDYHDQVDASGLTVNSTALNGLKLDNIDGTGKKEDDAGNSTGMVVAEASDAKITFNGATLKSANSTLTVNGLTLNILDKTDSEMTITVSKDTSAVYDAVKDFISEYNSILKSMNTSYNAGSAKGYDVLTSEMKEEMTDDEIEKWENVVKSSLLRRDDTLSGLISSFRNNMMASYTASDGKRYSLASLGIMTSTDYTEKGLLHIMGDEDDDVYMDSDNKLQSMLNKDPDLVMEILTGITGTFYDDLTKRMKSSKYSSALSFYNDKQMTEQVTKYKKDISTWETKLAEMEERYYSQFTAMEKAMANLQSQQNSLAGFFG